jgi:hypothetical protein
MNEQSLTDPAGRRIADRRLSSSPVSNRSLRSALRLLPVEGIQGLRGAGALTHLRADRSGCRGLHGARDRCPGQENSDALRPLPRDGIGEADLIAYLRSAVALKPERRELKERPEKSIRFMSATGG